MRKALYFVGLLIVVFLILLWVRPVTSSEVYRSSHYDGNKFVNEVEREIQLHLLHVLHLIFIEPWAKWPSKIQNIYKPTVVENVQNQAKITFINHASFLLQLDGVNIIFDPVFSDIVGPFNLVGVGRNRPPAIPLEALPKIDYILISHNHYDHLDIPTIKKIVARDGSRIIVPLGDAYWMEWQGFSRVQGLDWWESVQVDDVTSIHFVPAQHSSGRWGIDREQSFWGGYVVQNSDMSFFHSGDTGYAGHFKEIGKRFSIDVAFLTIGSYRPYELLGYVHMAPEESIQAYKDLGVKVAAHSMHYETFQLSPLAFKEAEEVLKGHLDKTENAKVNFEILEVGEERIYSFAK